MTCSYCGTPLASGEKRCRRCGRKDDDRLTGGLSLVTSGALAVSMRPAPRQISAVPRLPSDMRHAVQSSLFSEKLDSSIVMVASKPAKPTVNKPAVVKPRTKTIKRVSESQEKLELLEPAPAFKRTLSTTVEARVYCEALVAAPLHRAVAAAIDWAMVLIAYGVFLAVFCALGGQVVLHKTNLPIFGAALLLIAFTYSLLPAIATTETPGMRWSRLRLTTFDGFPLEPRQRLLRMLGSCLSVCSVVGLLWSLVDEESLAWQDHISGTFPTLAVDR